MQKIRTEYEHRVHSAGEHLGDILGGQQIAAVVLDGGGPPVDPRVAYRGDHRPRAGAVQQRRQVAVRADAVPDDADPKVHACGSYGMAGSHQLKVGTEYACGQPDPAKDELFEPHTRPIGL